MPENFVPSAVVHLDKPRRLTFTLGAARRFQHATGKKLHEIDESVIDPVGELPELIWAMAAGEDPTLTLEQVEEAIYPGNLEAVTTAVAQVLSQSMPEMKPDPLPQAGTPAENPPIAPISTSSGPTPGSTSESPTPGT